MLPPLPSLTVLMQRTQACAGHKRRALAFGLGVLATLALPPFFLFPLLVPAFTGLLWLIESAPTRRAAFWDGWWWGFGHFTTGLYWMCIALLTDPVKFGWLIPFTLGGLNGIIAIYIGIAALLMHALRMRRPVLRVCMFACVWTGVEFARGHLFTGFPWNLTGYSWAYFDSVSQAAAVFGVYGLSFVTVLAAAMPATRSRRAVAAVWVAFACMAGAGAWRLHMADVRPYGESFVPGVQLRVVQANIPQVNKWDPRVQMGNLRKQVELSKAAGWESVTHLIWPETAVPYALNISYSLVSVLYPAVPDNGAILTGTLRAESNTDSSPVWNSLAVIPQRSGPIVYYDKHHLVPFGEFVPLRHVLPLEKITPGNRDFSRGPGPVTMAIAGAPEASPLICYEAIFPGEAVDADKRPGWLVNITNDAWFGTSTGPYQHYYMTKMRAVEEGLPLVRAANTGISAVVDAYGRALSRLELGTEGVLDAKLPRGLPEKTIYGCIGNKYLLLLIVVLGFLLWFADHKRFVKR